MLYLTVNKWKKRSLTSSNDTNSEQTNRYLFIIQRQSFNVTNNCSKYFWSRQKHSLYSKRIISNQTSINQCSIRFKFPRKWRTNEHLNKPLQKKKEKKKKQDLQKIHKLDWRKKLALSRTREPIGGSLARPINPRENHQERGEGGIWISGGHTAGDRVPGDVTQARRELTIARKRSLIAANELLKASVAGCFESFFSRFRCWKAGGKRERKNRVPREIRGATEVEKSSAISRIHRLSSRSSGEKPSPCRSILRAIRVYRD